MTLKIFASEINILPFFLRYITMSKQQYWSLQAHTVTFFAAVLWFTTCAHFELYTALDFPTKFYLHTCKFQKQELFIYLYFHSLI